MIFIIVFSIIASILLGGMAYIKFAPQMGSKAEGNTLRRIESSNNFREKKFQNMIETNLDLPFNVMANTAWQMLTRGKSLEPKEIIQTIPINRERFKQAQKEEVLISWLGHSSLLISIQGKTFLTDPVFGERASMFSFAGPKKFKYDPQVTVDVLPSIDAVILSHDHYDHLDYKTILQLKTKVKKFYTPLGVAPHLIKWGIPADNIVELDWWESIAFNDELTFICTPSRHFSGRRFTRNETLWCSWILKGQTSQVFYGGDSGYYPGFKMIGDKYGPFDIVLLESGAYNENWSSIHMMPEQTVQASLDLKGKLLLPIHWGKFNLSLHPWKEPIQRLTKKDEELSVRVVTPKIGEIVDLNRHLPQTQWWQEYK